MHTKDTPESKRTHVKVRNAFALHASRRKAGYMKDKREPRKGARNKQRDYREDE